MISEVKQIMEALVKHELDETDAGIESFIQKSRKIRSIERMPGDASTRRYYRVRTHNTSEPMSSLIVMVMESFVEQGNDLPFLAIQRHLAEAGVDVPKVLDIDPKNGFIMLEDLGDITLLRLLQDVAGPDVEAQYFKRAVDELVKLHSKTGPYSGSAKKEKIEGFNLKFDTTKLMWEVNFTLEHFYQKHLNRNITENDMKTIQDGFTRICSELDREPTVFTHRDYHSRNIMIAPQGPNNDLRFVMIDFQDARMGPCQYDLASLLKDSYYQLDEKQVQFLTTYYYNQMKAIGFPIGDKAHFDRIFDLMAVQRNFKAIGSFASFLNRRGNPNYLKFIGNTFENIRRNLLKYPEFSALREVLYHYYYF